MLLSELNFWIDLSLFTYRSEYIWVLLRILSYLRLNPLNR